MNLDLIAGNDGVLIVARAEAEPQLVMEGDGFVEVEGGKRWNGGADEAGGSGDIGALRFVGGGGTRGLGFLDAK